MDNKLRTQCIVIGLLFMLKDTKSHQENYVEEDKFLPNFVTLGQKYSKAVGSTVVLPCKINETEHSTKYMLAWKRDKAVLTAGPVKVTVNPRIRLIEQDKVRTSPQSSSYNLEISGVKLTDAGEYACQIGSMEPKEIVHILEVLLPPKIETVNPSSRVDVAKGASIRLECTATGNPPPKIIWSRKNNVMPSGEPNITSNVLEVMHADRHTVGHYRCTADNKVGAPDTRDIFVNVLYAPEIELEHLTLHTGVGFEAQLTCIVHAEPSPHVVWYKDTTQLGTTEQHSQLTRGNKYSLIIRNVTYNDLGNYTCQASNNLGRDRANMNLNGLPTVCVFDSPGLSNYRDQYNISWSVQSYAPIREYRLFYRKQFGSTSHNNHEKLDNNVGTRFYSGTTYTGGSGTYTSGGLGMHHDQWENIVIPELHSGYHGNSYVHNHQSSYGYSSDGSRGSGGLYRDHNSLSHGIDLTYGSSVTRTGFMYNRHHNTRHRMSFLIRSLTTASNYEARVQARNDHGWNKLSNVFLFSTRADDLEVEPSAQPAVSKTAGVLDKDAFNGAASSRIGSSTTTTNILHFSSSSYINRILSIFLTVCAFLLL